MKNMVVGVKQKTRSVDIEREEKERVTRDSGSCSTEMFSSLDTQCSTGRRT